MTDGSNVIPFPAPRPPLEARVTIIRAYASDQFAVGIDCTGREWVLCGVVETYREAFDIAREKAAALGGLTIVDYSSSAVDEPDSAA